jgi:hypothetical protein
MTTEELLRIVARLEAEPTWEGYGGPVIGMVASEAGCTRREVEEAVEVAKRDAAPILTSGAGIRIATHHEQLLDQYRRARQRALHQLANNRGSLRAALAMKAREDSAVTPPAVLFPDLEDAA